MLEEYSPPIIHSVDLDHAKPNQRSSQRPFLFKLADKVFLIWYVIMITNTKSSINATSAPINSILLM